MSATLAQRPAFPWSAEKWGAASLVIIAGACSGTLLTLRPQLGLATLALLLILVMILRKPESGLYLIAAFLPFEQLTSLNENFSAIKLISLITFVSWSIRLVRTKQTFIDVRDKSSLFLLLFLALATLSLVKAEYFTPGLVRLASLFLLGLSYFMVTDLSANQKTSRTAMMILALSAGLAATVPIAQFALSGGLRATGAYLESGSSGLNLVVIIPLTVAFALQTQGRARYLFWLSFLLLLTGTVATISRGPLTALFAMLLLMAVSAFPRPRPKQILIALLIVMILSLPTLKYLSPRLTLEDATSSRAAGRFELWYAGREMFADNWLLGIGLANYQNIYYRYSSHIPWFVHRQPTTAHNLIVETAVETGVFGITTFLGFVFFSLARLRRSRQALMLSGDIYQAFTCSMLTISIVGLLVASLAYSTLFMKIPWLLLAFAAGLTNRPAKTQPLNGN